MEALVERLSQLDAQAEGAVRVVMFYDTLMRRRVDLPALARASAGAPTARRPPRNGCTSISRTEAGSRLDLLDPRLTSRRVARLPRAARRRAGRVTVRRGGGWRVG
jgi:hypothetical protein